MSNQSTKIAPLVRASVILPPGHGNTHDWMDYSQPYVKVFFDQHGSNLVNSPDQKMTTYVQIPSSTHAALRKATTELHSMFVKATEHVCKTPELWPAFGFPSQYWPRALASFFTGDKVISGRFDFSITPEKGIKCFEYNADCATCLLECAYVQGSWAKAVGIDSVGVDAGVGCEERLVNAWHLLNLPKGTLVHFLIEKEGEEKYHALYMMNAAQKAGFVCKLVKSGNNVENFTFDKAGHILDDEKKPVKYVWKTWCYTTLLSQWNGEPLRHSGQVRVIDVCLSENVLVFDPWWSAIPSNKAILPVLSEMFPDHPNLLHTSWEVTDRLKKSGYVAKPVSGRCGENIILHAPVTSSEPEVVESTDGRFKSNQYVYQELSKVPVVDNEYIQVNAFCIAGHYGGTVLRVDKSPIINHESSVDALRVVDDGTDTPLPTDEIANPYHHRKYIPEKQIDKVMPVETVEETDGSGPDTLAGKPAPFGAVMGYAPGGVPAYSCDYDTADRTVYTSRALFQHKVGKVYYGFRYQCVEFARRWLVHAKGVTFSEVGMAYEIFNLPHAIRVKDEENIPWTNIPNGSSERPVPGAVLIWNEGGEFQRTGHVAIVVEVSDEWVRVAEQNVNDTYWPRGQNWARQLAVEYDKAKGTYFIREVDGSVKGWKHLPKDFVPDPLPLPAYDTTKPL